MTELKLKHTFSWICAFKPDVKEIDGFISFDQSFQFTYLFSFLKYRGLHVFLESNSLHSLSLELPTAIDIIDQHNYICVACLSACPRDLINIIAKNHTQNESYND